MHNPSVRITRKFFNACQGSQLLASGEPLPHSQVCVCVCVYVCLCVLCVCCVYATAISEGPRVFTRHIQTREWIQGLKPTSQTNGSSMWSSLNGSITLYREMAVDYLQGRITAAKEIGPHNCPGGNIYTCKV